MPTSKKTPKGFIIYKLHYGLEPRNDQRSTPVQEGWAKTVKRQVTGMWNADVSARSPQKSATSANRDIQDSTRNCKRGSTDISIQSPTRNLTLNENEGEVPFIL